MGVVIRKANIEDAQGIAKVSVSSWKSSYKGIIPDSFLSSLNYEAKTKRWKNIINEESIVYVAEDESGNIVGFINGGLERTGDYIYKGELYAIYLYKENQGNGIGYRLVESLVTELIKIDVKSMLVWVLEENEYRRFYEKIGGSLVDSKQISVGGNELTEVAYGWSDISKILEK
jgi:GNAT superfamily N-acetyltransferase